MLWKNAFGLIFTFASKDKRKMKTEEQPNIVLAEKIEIRKLECAGECLYEFKCAFMNVCVCVYVCVCV